MISTEDHFDNSMITMAKMGDPPRANSDASDFPIEADCEFEEEMLIACLQRSSNANQSSNSSFLDHNKDKIPEKQGDVEDLLNQLIDAKLGNDEKDEYLYEFLFFVCGVEDNN